MRHALERLRLELVVPCVLALTVVAFAAGSSSVHGLRDAARPTRWAMLILLVVMAGAWAWAGRGLAAAASPAAVAAALFIAIALVSAAWSIEPRLTFERAVSLGLVFAAAILLASCRAPGRVLAGLLVGAVVVALAGLLVLAVDHRAAVSRASYEVPARYQGLGENPNTVALLLALALPIALAALTLARRRALVAAAVALLAGSIVASGSRGALVAATAGALVSALLVVRGVRARVLAAAAIVVLAAAGAYIESIPQPQPIVAVPVAAASATPARAPRPPRYADADRRYPLDADVGGPLPGGGQPTLRRSFLGSSGRVDAWIGAIHQAAERPLLGFGFGTEEHAFVDRYYRFVGSRPENAYIGVALQLGLVGLACLLALVGLLAVAGVRAVGGPQRPVAAAGLGVLAAGLVLALVQSYPYSAGDIASLTLWSSLFLLPAAAGGQRLVSKRLGWIVAAVGVAVLVGLVAVGRWERSRNAHQEVRGMERVRALVGPLDSPSLSGYRVDPAFDCLTYRRGENQFALELCFDPSGRLVEAIDRRTSTRRISSLRSDPSAATVRVDRREIRRLLLKMHAR